MSVGSRCLHVDNWTEVFISTWCTCLCILSYTKQPPHIWTWLIFDSPDLSQAKYFKFWSLRANFGLLAVNFHLFYAVHYFLSYLWITENFSGSYLKKNNNNKKIPFGMVICLHLLSVVSIFLLGWNFLGWKMVKKRTLCHH